MFLNDNFPYNISSNGPPWAADSIERAVDFLKACDDGGLSSCNINSAVSDYIETLNGEALASRAGFVIKLVNNWAPEVFTPKVTYNVLFATFILACDVAVARKYIKCAHSLT